jgi:hypothetical protein
LCFLNTRQSLQSCHELLGVKGLSQKTRSIREQAFLRQVLWGFLGDKEQPHLGMCWADSSNYVHAVHSRQHSLNQRYVNRTGVLLQQVFRIHDCCCLQDSMAGSSQNLCEYRSEPVMIVNKQDCTHHVLPLCGSDEAAATT